MLGSGSDFLLEFSDLSDQFFLLLHLHLLLLLLLLQDSSALFLFLIVEFPILLEHFFLLDFDVFLTLLYFLHELLLLLQLVQLEFLPLVLQLLGDLLHIIDKAALLVYLFLIGLNGGLASQLHLDLPALLVLHLVVPILFLLLLLPVFVLTLVTHVHLQVFHASLFLLDLLIELLLFTQDGSHV